MNLEFEDRLRGRISSTKRGSSLSASSKPLFSYQLTALLLTKVRIALRFFATIIPFSLCKRADASPLFLCLSLVARSTNSITLSLLNGRKVSAAYVFSLEARMRVMCFALVIISLFAPCSLSTKAQS
jgi:hypothetical protein